MGEEVAPRAGLAPLTEPDPATVAAATEKAFEPSPKPPPSISFGFAIQHLHHRITALLLKLHIKW